MNRKLQYSILGADLLWIAIVFIYSLRGAEAVSAAGILQLVYFPAILIACSIWAVLYFRKKLEGFRGGWYFPSVFAQVIVGVFYLVGSLLVLALLTNHYYSRSALLYLVCLLPAGFITIRCLAWWAVMSRSGARPRRRVVILGSGRLVRELALKIVRHPEISMEVAGILFPAGTEPAKQTSNLPAGTVSIRSLNVLSLMQNKQVEDLIVVEPVPPGTEPLKLISNCRKAGMRVHLVPQHYELYLSKAKLTEIDDVPLLSLEEQTLPAIGLQLKRAMDLLGASLLLGLSAPLLVFSALALHLNKKPTLRKELRCGKHGRPFWMHRLNIDRDASNLAPYERVLAQFSLTELPQLWNVLRGEMSLVGPRPESPDRVKHYSMWQMQRLSVIPGLTGLAQVNGLREQHSSEEKARFDLQYIFHWSLFQDISLLLQTAWTFLTRLIGEDGFSVTPKLKSLHDAELFIPRVLNADSTQSGAD
ncbi:MAG TPA: sugar transferase [Terriglobales bacterium]|jgi:lipopolysaccharide/colanic/teichoic acid biosynthesis glycosyltransferase|nr:sugar transferase [Terriglobales bacterium]